MPEDIIARLEQLAADMACVAVDLEYHGGFNAEIVEHSRELLGASAIARGWAKGMRELNLERQDG